MQVGAILVLGAGLGAAQVVYARVHNQATVGNSTLILWSGVYAGVSLVLLLSYEHFPHLVFAGALASMGSAVLLTNPRLKAYFLSTQSDAIKQASEYLKGYKL